MDLDKNAAVFTTKDIISGKAPILLVSHDKEGDWQFLNGSDLVEDNAALISLLQVIEIDSSVEFLLNLPKGSVATRISKNGRWRIV